MRVTGGTARGRRLKSPRAGVRPTSDLVRGAIFDVLDPSTVSGARALDLYAGSGALGIEALSRGAASCDFVERDGSNATLIRENMTLADMAGRGKVHKVDAARAGGRLAGPYTLVLADPPYDDEDAVETIGAIAASAVVAGEATLVLELSGRREAPDRIGPLARTWQRRYGDAQVAIYERTEAPS